jgi:hypothetical protein
VRLLAIMPKEVLHCPDGRACDGDGHVVVAWLCGPADDEVPTVIGHCFLGPATDGICGARLLPWSPWHESDHAPGDWLEAGDGGGLDIDHDLARLRRQSTVHMAFNSKVTIARNAEQAHAACGQQRKGHSDQKKRDPSHHGGPHNTGISCKRRINEAAREARSRPPLVSCIPSLGRMSMIKAMGASWSMVLPLAVADAGLRLAAADPLPLGGRHGAAPGPPDAGDVTCRIASGLRP